MSTPAEQTVRWQNILLAEIEAAGVTSNEKATDAILKSMIDDYWAVCDNFAAWPKMRYLKVKGLVLTFWGTTVWRLTDFEEAGVREDLEQQGLSLQRLKADNDAEITLLLMQGNGNRAGGAVGQMLTKTPLPYPPTAYPNRIDPNDQSHSGDARFRWLRLGW